MTGQSRFFLNYGDEVDIERKQIEGRKGNMIDSYIFLPSLMRALVDRDVLIVTNENMTFPLQPDFRRTRPRICPTFSKESMRELFEAEEGTSWE